MGHLAPPAGGTSGYLYLKQPYREVERDSPLLGGNGPVFRPMLTIRLTNLDTGASTKLRALIDTGAPVTVLNGGAAELLGIRLGRAGADIREVDIGGKKGQRVQFERVSFTVVELPQRTWQTTVGFLREWVGIPFAGVLGDFGFLDQWVVTMHRSANYFTLRDIASFDRTMQAADPETMASPEFDSEWFAP
jgi:hypothetical protein